MMKWQAAFSQPAAAALTVVGMAKNTGKTVTMNCLQQMLRQENYSLGLLSIGLDGEKVDALTRLPKPAVFVEPGTLIATAEQVIEDSSKWDYLKTTAIHTPLGKIAILRSGALQKVILAGPSKNREVKDILNELTAFGAERIILDGAFDRQSSVQPDISNQVVLATGATLSKDLSRLIMLTKCRVEQLTLAECDDACQQIITRGTAKVKLISGKQVEHIQSPTTLLSFAEWSSILQTECDSLVLCGAIADELGEALLKNSRNLQVIVQDGSKIFIKAELWTRLRQKNIIFKTQKAINLLGVTVNPVFPGEAGYDPDELLNALGKALAPLPVIDMTRKVKYKGSGDEK